MHGLLRIIVLYPWNMLLDIDDKRKSNGTGRGI
jgi:hypothetical protein